MSVTSERHSKEIYQATKNTAKTSNVTNMGDEGEEAYGWEKPAWAKGGVKLKKTGKADQMKGEGNLAAPITFTPFKNQDHTNRVADPNKLARTEVGEAAKQGEDLAAPITFTPYKVRLFLDRLSSLWPM